MKGLGPDWTDKKIEVFLDDVDPSLSQSKIHDMVVLETMCQLKGLGFIQYTIVDIFSA